MARVNVKDWLTDEGLTKIEGWARDGLVDEEIAHNIGCATGTLYAWKNKHHEIYEALKKGKEVVDRKVENALLKKALGFSTVEITEERTFNELTNEFEMVESKRVHKQVPPDTTAMIFWLKNRKPNEWRDKRDVQHSGEMTTNINNLSALSEKELRKLAESVDD